MEQSENLSETLRLGAEELGLSLSGEALERLVGLALLLARWAENLSLTAHSGPDAILRRLVLDALALAAAAPEHGSLADVGSGPGFPGLPVAIAHPERSVTLIESRERPHHFQRAALRELGLGNVQLVRGRAEGLAPTPHDAAVAQAVASPEQALRWLAPWVRPGGWLLLPTGPEEPELVAPDDVEPAGWVGYSLPLGGAPRGLWIGKRSASS